ncbi:MAG TPA: hypothetical protein VH591_03100 [Ktedonobacterales bacterium]|jgi:hypothetical protein
MQGWNGSLAEKRHDAALQSFDWQALRQTFMAERIEREHAMSFRPDVSREDIERFLN